MENIFKIFLTINSLLLALVVFLINKEMVINSLHPSLSGLPYIISYIFYFLVVLLLTWASVKLAKFLDTDTIKAGSISVIEPAFDAFLPSYLGYFFVALSISNIEVFI